MTIKATQKYTRQTGRKVRLVANTVRKLPLEEALRQLAVIERRSTLVILKTVKQAIANAINNHGLKFAQLKLENIIVDNGPQYQRMRAVSRGRGHEIKKRTSHITVTLTTMEAGQTLSDVKAETKAEAVTTQAESSKTVSITKSKTKDSKVSKKVTK